MQLTILGNNSALPNHNRFPTAQILAVDNELYLIDCGEGTQVRIIKHGIKSGKISKIFISHLHGDHYFGLIGLLTRFSLNNRTEPIDLYGPERLIDIINIQLQVAATTLSFPLTFHPIKTETSVVVLDEDTMKITAFATEHRIECYGYKFEKKFTEKSLLIEKCIALDIPTTWYKRIKKGEDVQVNNTIIKNESLTAPLKENIIYSYCADSRFTTKFIETVRFSNLLYHETTYLKDQKELSYQRYHSSTEDAARMAQLTDSKQLLIGHFSSKYAELDAFRLETTQIFPNTILAQEGLVIDIE